MNKSYHIGTFFGIPIKVHWTFSLVFVVVSYIILTENLNIYQSLALLLYMFCLFLCVVLHEYGHALTARKFGVQTRDILLSPIGGLARLERIPEKPIQEFLTAIAGPLVNLAIALILFISLLFCEEIVVVVEEDLSILTNPVGFLQLLLMLNIILFGFNLLPAFPMDGGRILRSLLSMKLPRLQATKIASLIGRLFSIAFVVIGFYYNIYALVFIGIFVYVMAYREYEVLKMKQQDEIKLII